MKATRFLIPCLLLGACTADVAIEEHDLDTDDDLQMMLADTTPELQAVDTDTVLTLDVPAHAAHAVSCTRQRFLHVGNYSYVAKLNECVNGACPNGCWGVQERVQGTTCEYDANGGDYVTTRAGTAPFATYNEIKSLHPRDATAVANCRAETGLRVRTYTVWNGTGWNSEGIDASVHFAETYGPQNELAPSFWTWYGSFRGSYAPMVNMSPETGVDADGVKRWAARICSATRNGWAGIYFYDADASGGAGMADWKREAIIRGMNYCTTH